MSARSKSRRKSTSSSGTPDSSSRSLPSPQPRDDASLAPPLVFRVVEIDSQDGDFGATLWMPQAAMLSASLSASQLVWVAVCPEGPDAVDTLETQTAAKGYFEHCYHDSRHSLKDLHSNVSAIAVAWPSGKLKDGIRISKQLAYALGSVQSSSCIELSPINCSRLNHGKVFPFKTAFAVEVNVEECKEVIFKGKLSMLEDSGMKALVALPSSAISGRITQGILPNGGRSEESAVSILSKQRNAIPQYMILQNACNALTLLLGDEKSSARRSVECLAGRLLHGRYLLKGNCVGIPVCGHIHIFQMVDATVQSETKAVKTDVQTKADKEIKLSTEHIPTLFYIGRKTLVKFELPERATSQPHATSKNLSSEHTPLSTEKFDYSALGGLSEQISTLREIISYSLLYPDRLLSIGLQPPRGVLLYGPPGTGKTSLALASATETGVKFFCINGPEIVSEYYGESEASLKAVFTAAHAAAPSVVFIDELDAIAPQRTEESEHLSQRIVATLLAIMDGSEQSLNGVLVIAATNRVETIDPALRRPGRFDREIEIGVPSPSGRLEILLSHLSRTSHSLADSDIEALAAETHGFVGADLASLCQGAALEALRLFVQKDAKNGGPAGLKTDLQKLHSGFESQATALSSCTDQLECLSLMEAGLEKSLKVSINDFKKAKARIRPSALREVMLEVPKVWWSDIGGQEITKQQLQEAVEWPQKHKDAFVRIGTCPPKGILLYGPPGCSKTLMARAVATEAGLNFLAVKGPELFSKWVGESEKAVRQLFHRARIAAPSVVFFDELDGLAVSRESDSHGVSVGDRVISQLLVELDGLGPRKDVTVIAATNRPDKIDTALLRPGRFDRLLYVGPPDEEERLQILEIHLRDVPCAVDVDRQELARRTNGYTGADLASICREAATTALEEDLNASEVKMRHFDAALNSVQRSVSDVAESAYTRFRRGMRMAAIGMPHNYDGDADGDNDITPIS